MLDQSLPYVDLVMERPNLQGLPDLALPAGYSLRLYQPGDQRHWARITRLAGEFLTNQGAYRAFDRYYGPARLALPRRMLFLLDAAGLPVGTVTAWEDQGHGQLHWVAIIPEHQGKGLSRPMCAAALRLMRDLGSPDAFLHTQTWSWVAIGVYANLGFVPRITIGSLKEARGWDIVRNKLPGRLP